MVAWTKLAGVGACAMVVGIAGASLGTDDRAHPGEEAPSRAPAQDASRRNHAVWTVLDALHSSASTANFDRYFAQFAPGAIFLGTDGTERWTVDEFKAYTRPYFEKGKGWTYVPRDRHIHFAQDGRVCWFDELLDNEKYGECRGSGVVVFGDDGQWRIAQYNLSKTIPNEKMAAVVEAIGAGGAVQ
mgnify:CR=1 FL=1